MSDLDDRLLAAHAAGDTSLLIDLYTEAADAADSDDARYFYLTHAFVFALELGSARAEALCDRLVAAGRETPLSVSG